MTAPQASDTASAASARSQRFLLACRREPTDVTPVWMMRQAGRCIPAYRKLREKYAFLELVQKPDLMAQVTLLPIDVLDVDAAILFADIMLPLAALGIHFEIVETIGPVITEPIESRAQVDRFSKTPIAEAVPSVMECISIVRSQLDGVVPVIGFSGAPFTLACYLIEGRADRTREYQKVKALIAQEPGTWHALMEKLTAMVIEYLDEQVKAGIQAVQLFDSWAGALGYADYAEFVQPYTLRIFDSLAGAGIPRITFGTNTAGLLELMAAADCEVVSVDWRIPLDVAWDRIGHDKAVQGNLDPVVLQREPEVIDARVRDVLARAGGRPGHIFNLGHGVLPGTEVDAIRRAVDLIHESAR